MGWGTGIKARAKGRARLGFRLGVRVRVGVLGDVGVRVRIPRLN